jgi:RHS repeat-associated protein
LDDEARLYYTGDANYNVTAVLDAAGAVQSYNVYDAYGKATVYDANWANTAPASDGPLYCGYFFDAETGNYLARNRYYSVAIAAWFTRDPLMYKAKDMNLYEYVGDDPVDQNDPTGLCNIKIRCGPVTRKGIKVGMHCGVIGPDGVEYGLGGGNSSSGSSGTATPYPFNPYQPPAPAYPPPGVIDYPVSCPGHSCCEVQQSIQDYHDYRTPPPYDMAGPNSNTYAHGMLTYAGCTVNPIPQEPIVILPTYPPVYPPSTIYPPPTTNPPGAVGW